MEPTVPGERVFGEKISVDGSVKRPIFHHEEHEVHEESKNI
jgi:hypothetical protein